MPSAHPDGPTGFSIWGETMDTKSRSRAGHDWSDSARPVSFRQGASAQNADTVPAKDPGEDVEEVVVTGFRASLAEFGRREARQHHVLDSIFAEDIGKFPDLNLAESLQRIPGVQIARDFTGEGTSVAVRGLGSDFTQITLNGAPVETASDSNIDNVSQGRGLDLVLFPTELFRQLTVSKTPAASQQEGAVAANIDLRVARPFDDKGFHINYSAKGNLPGIERRLEPASRLVREQHLGNRHRRIRHPRRRRLFESQVPLRWIQHHRLHDRRRSATAALFATDPQCNSFVTPNNETGYGNQAQAWPTTRSGGLQLRRERRDMSGDPLTVCGAGDTAGGTSSLSCRDLSFAIWPRLARPDMLIGERETTSGILAMQWAPSDKLAVLHRRPVFEGRPSCTSATTSTSRSAARTPTFRVNVVLNEDNIVTQRDHREPGLAQRKPAVSTKTRISSTSTAA